jgi:hypothetical protein
MPFDPAAEILGLTHINDLSFLIMKIVYARQVGQFFQVFCRKIRRQVLLTAPALEHRLEVSSAVRLEDPFEQNGSGVCVPSCPVPVIHRDAQLPAELSQSITRKARKYFPAQPNRA